MKKTFKSLVAIIMVISMILPNLIVFGNESNNTTLAAVKDELKEEGFLYNFVYYYCEENKSKNVYGDNDYKYYCYYKDNGLFPIYIFFDSGFNLVTNEEIISDLCIMAYANVASGLDFVKQYYDTSDDFSSAASSLRLKDITTTVLEVTGSSTGALSTTFFTGGTVTAASVAKIVAEQTLDAFKNSMTDVLNIVSGWQTLYFCRLADRQEEIVEYIKNPGSLNTFNECKSYVDKIDEMQLNSSRAKILLSSIAEDTSQGWGAVAETLGIFASSFIEGFVGDFAEQLQGDKIEALKNLDSKTMLGIVEVAKRLADNPAISALETMKEISDVYPTVFSKYFTVLGDILNAEENITSFTIPIISLSKVLSKKFIGESVPETIYSIGTYKITTKDGLNIRSGAGTSYSKIAAMPYLTQFIVTKVNGSWGYTTYGGRSGWAYLGGGYTKFVSSSTTPVSTTVGSAAVTKKIDNLISLINGKYFTTTQKDCGNNACAKCLNSNIINTSWFKTLFGNIGSVYQFPAHWCANSGKYLSGAGYTCYGFAAFAQWYIFKVNNTDYISDVLVTQNAAWNYDNVIKYCKPGDVLRLGMSSNKDRHSAIFISCDSTGVNVLDCNYSGDCKVSTRKYYYSYWTNFSVSRASNYDVIANGEVEFTEPSQAPETNYDTIIPEDTMEYPNGWIDEIPNGDVAENYRTATFYRYRDVENETVYDSWSENIITTEKPVESDLVEIVSEGDYYSYYHYCNNYYNGSYNVDSVQYGTGGVYHTKLSKTKMTASNISDKGGKTLYGGEAEFACSNGFRVWAQNDPLTVHVYTYRTRSKTEKTVYTSWSEWSKNVPESIEGREIENVVLYNRISDINETYPEGWVKEISAEDVEESYETKTFYRFRTSEQKTVYGDWSANQTGNEAVTESETVDLVSQNTYYSYYHYCNNYYNGSYNVDSIQYGTGGVYHTKLTSTQMTASNIGDKGGKTLYGGEAEFACDNGFRVWAQNDPLEVVEYVYRTRTKTEKTVYTPWSEWSEAVPKESENKEIESVVLYKKLDALESIYPKGWIKDIPEGESSDSYLSKTFYRYHTVSENVQYSDWSAEQKTTDSIAESDTVDIVSQSNYYSYYHYCNNYYNGSYNVDSIQYGTGGVYHTKLSNKKMTASNIGDRGGKTLYGGEAEFACDNGFRVWAQNEPIEVTEYTYRTRTKTVNTVYTPWSNWSITKPDEAENRVIESIVLYTKWDEDTIAAGTSLILDGTIGVKVYLDIADEISEDTIFTASVYDTKSDSVMSNISAVPEYDGEKGLYYVTAFVAPKDAEKTEIRGIVEYGGDSITLGAVKITDYILSFKELAEGNIEYAKAVKLVNALENYIEYTNGFFGGSNLDTVSADIGDVTAPSKTGSLDGVEHYATSLILEGNTTIRHYFKTNGGVCTFKCGDEILPYVYLGENIVCVDITDIPAHDLDKEYTVTVNDAYSITYSALNYIVQCVDSDNAQLSNLVKSLYNYWYQTEQYIK